MASIPRKLYIDGKFVESSDGKTFEVRSPYTGKVSALVYEASKSDADKAVLAATAAFQPWSALGPEKRGALMTKLAELIEQHHDEFARLEALSMGRPISTYFDSKSAAHIFRHFAHAGYTVLGTSSTNTPGFMNMMLRQPLGVVANIIPWNVPMLFLAKKMAPALITGNTVVLKSSEKAPLTSLKMAELIHEAGFPPGVVNVLSGDGKSGAHLSSHMGVQVLSFTGSSRTGRLIQVAAAQSNLKKVILELGGKSPAIIFDDADLDEAAKATAHSITWNTGQTCMANTRIYVHENVVESFLPKFKLHLQSPRRGDPLDAAIDVGPVADEVQYRTVQKYVELGRTSGETVLGDAAPAERPEGSLMVSPTIFTNTPEDARIMKEEVFGPVANINTFSNEDEAITKANDTDYGLYGSLFTRDLARAMRVSQRLECGTVAVNCTSPTSAFDMPFGGYKLSGQGREGIVASLENYLEQKSILIKVA